MKKIIYLILIILALISFCFLFFKKDYGYDKTFLTQNDSILGVTDVKIEHFNKTIDNIDYLVTKAPIGKFGGILTTTILGDPKTFNPYNANDSTSATLAELMYDGLVSSDPYTGNVVPKLAKSFQVLNDKKTYIIKLRKGLKWSDGVEITADDVYFTYRTIIFSGFGDGSAKDSMMIDGQLPTVEKIDKYTVKFTTPKPFAPFLRNLSASIVPKHVFKNATDKGKEYFLTFQNIDTKPADIVYSGPFALKEYIPSQRVIFEKNPNYYLINTLDQKLPYLDKWIMLVVGDTNNDTLKFESGVTDVLSVNGALFNRYREMKKQGDFELYNLGPTNNTNFIVFNLNNRKNKDGIYYVEPVKQKWFQDKNFRAAIDWAIDRDDLNLNIYSGLSVPLYSAESINSMFLNKKVAKGHKKDIEYAKQLLLKSGFYYKNNVLYDKNNNKVEFELLTNAGNTQREAIGVSIKQDLEQLGIKVNFKAVEFHKLIDRMTVHADYDAVIMGLTSDIYEPNAGCNVWNAYGSLHLFNKRTPNDLAETDKILDFELELENLFKKGALELDFNKRKEIYDKYQEIIADENPFVYLVAPLNIEAIRTKVKNIFPTKTGGLMHNISEIYIDK